MATRLKRGFSERGFSEKRVLRLLLTAALFAAVASSCQERRQSQPTSRSRAQLIASPVGSGGAVRPSDAQAAPKRAAASRAPETPLESRLAAGKGLPRTPASFAQAKREALKIYADHRTTFYCGCRFGSNRQVLWQSCGYRPRANAVRARRIEWEHIVPAAAFGAYRQCWTAKLCRRERSGKGYGGRSCCSKIDRQFRRMEADLQNLVPAVGEVNGDRAHFAFGEVSGEPRQYGECDFEIDWYRRIAEPRSSVRGDIARAYLYMYHVYPGALRLDPGQLAQLKQWHRADPPSTWERTRDRRIAALQGMGNPLVQ
jgi:deoxyribonuclease-1